MSSPGGRDTCSKKHQWGESPSLDDGGEDIGGFSLEGSGPEVAIPQWLGKVGAESAKTTKAWGKCSPIPSRNFNSYPHQNFEMNSMAPSPLALFSCASAGRNRRFGMSKFVVYHHKMLKLNSFTIGTSLFCDCQTPVEIAQPRNQGLSQRRPGSRTGPTCFASSCYSTWWYLEF